LTGGDKIGRGSRDGRGAVDFGKRATRKEQLLSRLRRIEDDAGNLDARVETARRAFQDERPRFTSTDAGRIQWNWYVDQFVVDLGLERHRLARSVHKPAKPGEIAPGLVIELLDRLGPRILELREAKDRAAD
jgi:hypothetical protein